VTVHPLDNLFRIWLPLGAASILTTVLVVGVLTESDRYTLGYEPSQPIEYSHKVHAGDNKIPCLYCHSGASRSRHAGVPALAKCMNCHQVTKLESEKIQRIKQAVESGETFPWTRIHTLPDHAYFDHRPHVNAGIECQECHGPVETMEKVSREMNMRMGKCLECHRGERSYYYGPKPDALGPTNCWACHR
jgi:hypothetical protein